MHHRRLAEQIACLDVGAAFDQRIDQRGIAGTRGHHQRGRVERSAMVDAIQIALPQHVLEVLLRVRRQVALGQRVHGAMDVTVTCMRQQIRSDTPAHFILQTHHVAF